jgi:8-oxo-dGTP diphosphatase
MASPQHPAHPRHKYTAIPRVLIFPELDGKILLLKGAPTKALWPNMYNGVGGHVEPGETIKQAALRELEEETGIKAIDLALCGMVNVNLGDERDDIILFVFTCHAHSTVTRSGPEGTLEWFAWDDLPTSNLLPDLPELLPRVRSAASTNQPFYALYTYNPDGSLQITFTD